MRLSKTSLPLYSQLPNCCGISTYLMLINPEKNLKFKEFLNTLYSKIQFLKKENSQEFKWTVVLDYILLKYVGNNLRIMFNRISNRHTDLATLITYTYGKTEVVVVDEGDLFFIANYRAYFWIKDVDPNINILCLYIHGELTD